MTPQQRAALNGLIAPASMTTEQEAAIDLYLDANNRNDVRIAELLSAAKPRAVVVGQTITTRGAAARFPALGGLPRSLSFEAATMALENFAAAGASSPDLLTKLLARAVTRQLEGFGRLGLDFGEPELRTMLDLLTTVPSTEAPVLTVAQAAGFKALAEMYVPFSVDAVSRALNVAEGRMTL